MREPSAPTCDTGHTPARICIVTSQDTCCCWRWFGRWWTWCWCPPRPREHDPADVCGRPPSHVTPSPTSVTYHPSPTTALLHPSPELGGRPRRSPPGQTVPRRVTLTSWAPTNHRPAAAELPGAAEAVPGLASGGAEAVSAGGPARGDGTTYASPRSTSTPSLGRFFLSDTIFTGL